jgi:hypothetical protein
MSDAPPKDTSKKVEREPYVTPELRLLGDVLELTQGETGSKLDSDDSLTLA